MIRFNITDHAIQRFQERVTPSMSYNEARYLLENGLLTASRLKRRATNGEDLWHITALGCVAICAPDHFGKAERIVRTIITEQMAQIDTEGCSNVLEEDIELEIIDSAEKTVEKITTASKHRSPEEHLPEEVRHAPIGRKETSANLHRLLMIAQADLAKVREVEKTRRTTITDKGVEAKVLLRRLLCALILEPTPLVSRLLAETQQDRKLSGFLSPEFLRCDPAYKRVEASGRKIPVVDGVDRPAGAVPDPNATQPAHESLRALQRAVEARVDVLETQAKEYDVVRTRFPPTQLEALCTYRLLLSQIERMLAGDPLQGERLR